MPKSLDNILKSCVDDIRTLYGEGLKKLSYMVLMRGEILDDTGGAKDASGVKKKAAQGIYGALLFN